MGGGKSNNESATAAGASKWRVSFPYKVDYNDHFETPLIAYQDILPLLDFLIHPTVDDSHRKPQQHSGDQRANFCVYDPYYCNGKAATLLREIGFENVVHAPRDFYKDIEQNCVPNYDALVTNPPYSDQHKADCLRFCFRQLRTQNKPFFILMPNYVAARSYYREHLHANQNGKNFDDGSSSEDVCYIIPNQPYEYQHPEGTGHDIPPFASLWFCGIGKDRVRQVRDYWVEHLNQSAKAAPNKIPRLAVSVEELQQWNVIPTEKRPNPRQRRKRKQQRQPSEGTEEGKVLITEPKYAASAKKSSKASKYRNKDGGRARKRF